MNFFPFYKKFEDDDSDDENKKDDNDNENNKIKLLLPNKNGLFTNDFKIYQRIKDNDIIEINNIKNIIDLENFLKNKYLNFIPLIRIKYIYIINSSYEYAPIMVGFKIILEKLIINYINNIDNMIDFNLNFNYIYNNNCNDIIDDDNNFKDKSDYPNDFYNLFNIVKINPKSNLNDFIVIDDDFIIFKNNMFIDNNNDFNFF